jgi:tight adherence protein C
MPSLFLAGLFGVAVFIFFVGLGGTLSLPNAVNVRLQQYGARPRTLEEIELSAPFTERVLTPLIRGMAGFITRFAPKQNMEAARTKLDLAGNPNDWTVTDFLGVRGLSAVFTTLVALLLAFALRSDPAVLLLFFGIGGTLGFFLPVLWLGMKIRSRQHEILKALPDALDLLTISVEAGLAFDSAMAKVAEKWDNELSRAFGRVIAEVRVGKVRREALRDMSDRTDVPDVKNFIAAVIQADQLGVSIAKVLRIQSEQMRVKRRQRAEEQANQAPVKMMIPLAFLIFPSIFIVLLGPTVLIFVNGGFGLQ